MVSCLVNHPQLTSILTDGKKQGYLAFPIKALKLWWSLTSCDPTYNDRESFLVSIFTCWWVAISGLSTAPAHRCIPGKSDPWAEVRIWRLLGLLPFQWSQGKEWNFILSQENSWTRKRAFFQPYFPLATRENSHMNPHPQFFWSSGFPLETVPFSVIP